MDIRDSEAQRIIDAFNRSRIRLTSKGFENLDTHAEYVKTNHGRFVRYDQDIRQYNVLSSNRKAFMPVDSLRPGEAVIDRNFGREQLLPDRTMWDYVKDNFLPALGITVGLYTLQYLSHHIVGWIPAAGRYVAEHLCPDHDSAGRDMPPPRLRRLAANDGFDDSGSILDRDTLDRDQEDAMRWTQQDAETEFCRTHPEDCRPRRMLDPVDNFATGVISTIGARELYRRSRR